MSGKRFSGNKSNKNGFYLALAVCLVAVGIAAWSTYEAVQGYLTADDTAEKGQSSQVTDNSRNETVKIKPTPAPTPAENVGTTPEETTPTEEVDTPNVEEETATEPLYIISEVMTAPVSSNQIIKAYSKGAPVFSETMKDWRIHTGTDYAAEVGEDVTASANGLVKQTYTDSMLGNVVVIEHGDYVFYYCGVGENFEVKEGDVVSAGQKIGAVTAVPFEAADASHIHLEIKCDGAYMDPAEVLSSNNG